VNGLEEGQYRAELVFAAGPNQPVVSPAESGTFTVEAKRLVGLDVSKQTLTLKPQESYAFKVFARYSDGSANEITNDGQTVYKSSDAKRVSVQPGVITAGKLEGKAVITVSYGDLQAKISVHVSNRDFTGLTTSAEKVTLEAGRSKQVKATALFSKNSKRDVTKEAIWQSSDPEVAVVESGKIVAKTPGTATITVSFGEQTAMLTVTVTEKKVKRLTLSKRTLRLMEGKEDQVALTAYYSDGSKEVVTDKADWTVKDDRVANVENGTISAVAPGKTTITASYRNMSAKWTLTVTKYEVKSLTISKRRVTLKNGNELKLELRAYYSDYSRESVADKATWESQDEGIATVQNGVITAVAPGKTKIKATYLNKTVIIDVTVTD
jgi:hypothetical protein